MKIAPFVMNLFIWLCVTSTALASAGDAPNMGLDSGFDDFASYYGDEEFISIATGSSKPIYKAPSVASVITASQLEEMGATTLNDALETVPGLHVALSSLSRLDSVYSIRGLHTGINPQVLMLINGIPFPYAYTGSRPLLFEMPITSISRIEVLRGPGSAVYGADAFSGVINIITKEASEINGTHVGARFGSFDSQEVWLQHGKRYGAWDIAFSFNYQDSDGDSGRKVSSDFQTTMDQWFGTEASLAPGSLSTRYTRYDTHLEIKRDAWSLRLWNWKLHDAGIGTGGAQALDPHGRQDVDQFLADLGYENDHLHADWQLEANTSYLYRYNETQFTLLPAGAVAPIGNDGNLNFTSPAGIVSFPDGIHGNPSGTDNQLAFDLAAIYSGWKTHRLRVGAGIKYLRFHPEEEKNFGPGVIDGSVSPIDGRLTDVSGTPYVFSPIKSRTVRYVSLQDEWAFAPDWELTAGVRYDHYSDFGQTINPRLALVWETRYNLTTKLLYGSAFRAPSFGEFSASNNPVTLGNEDLDPETIDTLELAFDYRPTFDLHTNLSLFAYRAKDLITYVSDAGASTKTAQNSGDQDGYGFELEATWKIHDNLTMTGNYAWQHSEDHKTHERIADAPRQQLYLTTNWEFLPNCHLTPQLYWIGDRERSATDNRSAVDDYTLAHLTLRIDNLLPNWQLSLAARNLFDEDAFEPSSGAIGDDYPLEGRSFWLALNYRFAL